MQNKYIRDCTGSQLFNTRGICWLNASLAVMMNSNNVHKKIKRALFNWSPDIKYPDQVLVNRDLDTRPAEVFDNQDIYWYIMGNYIKLVYQDLIFQKESGPDKVKVDGYYCSELLWKVVNDFSKEYYPQLAQQELGGDSFLFINEMLKYYQLDDQIPMRVYINYRTVSKKKLTNNIKAIILSINSYKGSKMAGSHAVAFYKCGKKWTVFDDNHRKHGVECSYNPYSVDSLPRIGTLIEKCGPDLLWRHFEYPIKVIIRKNHGVGPISRDRYKTIFKRNNTPFTSLLVANIRRVVVLMSSDSTEDEKYLIRDPVESVDMEAAFINDFIEQYPDEYDQYGDHKYYSDIKIRMLNKFALCIVSHYNLMVDLFRMNMNRVLRYLLSDHIGGYLEPDTILKIKDKIRDIPETYLDSGLTTEWYEKYRDFVDDRLQHEDTDNEDYFLVDDRISRFFEYYDRMWEYLEDKELKEYDSDQSIYTDSHSKTNWLVEISTNLEKLLATIITRNQRSLTTNIVFGICKNNDAFRYFENRSTTEEREDYEHKAYERDIRNIFKRSELLNREFWERNIEALGPEISRVVESDRSILLTVVISLMPSSQTGGRLIKRDRSVGKKMAARPSRTRVSSLPKSSLVLNPATGRYVKRDGRIGRRLCGASKKKQRSTARR